jgi:hypothetical protein
VGGDGFENSGSSASARDAFMFGNLAHRYFESGYAYAKRAKEDPVLKCDASYRQRLE